MHIPSNEMSTSSQDNECMTPYQGKKRCFGSYYCEECRRSWKSGNSWANKGCDWLIYPHRQRPLTKTQQGYDSKKPHETEMCEMCMELGSNCADLDRMA